MNEKRTILLIEDERAISNFICRALTANDYKAVSASSGKEGLSLFFSHCPDLVLLDLGLPDMDGLDVLSQLSGLPQEVPVIIISARDRESEKVKALDMGADDYFYSGNLCFMEWPEMVEEALPEDTIRITITPQEDGTRIIEF